MRRSIRAGQIMGFDHLLKYALVILVTIPFLHVQAQLHVEGFEHIKKEKHLEKLIWKDGLTYDSFDHGMAAAFPDADAVIMDLRYYFAQNAKTYSGSSHQRTLFRMAVLLRTEQAVDEYLSFDFGPKEMRDKWVNVGIRVFKPDGRVIEIAEEEIGVGMSDRKIALPDLQVDDIMEVYFYLSLKFAFGSLGYNGVSTFEFQRTHPCLNYHLELLANDGVRVKYRCSNGAPAPKVEAVDNLYFDARAVFKGGASAASVPDEWRSDAYLDLPYVQYSMVYGRMMPAVYDLLQFTPDYIFSGKATDQLDKDMTLAVVNGAVDADPDMSRVLEEVRGELAEQMDTLSYSSERERSLDAYRRLRHIVRVEKNLSTIWFPDGSILNGFYKWCRAQHMDPRWYVGRLNVLGATSETMSAEELIGGLLVPVGENDTLYFRMENRMTPAGLPSELLLGARLLTTNTTDKKRVDFQRTRLPLPEAEDNTEIIDIRARVVGDSVVAELNHRGVGHASFGARFVCGEVEQNVCDRYALLWPSAYDVENSGYPGMASYTLSELSNIRRQDSTAASSGYAALMLDNAYARVSSKIRLEEENFDSMRVASIGHYSPEDTSHFSVQLSLQEQLTNLESGRLLSLDMIRLLDVDHTGERHSDVHFFSPGRRIVDFTLERQEGMLIQGLEEVGQTVENESGRLEVSLIETEGVIGLHVDLYIYKAVVAAEDWQDMRSIIDGLDQVRASKLLITYE